MKNKKKKTCEIALIVLQFHLVLAVNFIILTKKIDAKISSNMVLDKSYLLECNDSKTKIT